MRSAIVNACRVAVRTFVVATVLAWQPVVAHSATIDPICGQPLSQGDEPVTSDCLACLKCALGLCFPSLWNPCVCDTDANGSVTARDALRCLKRAVGQPVGLVCDCPPDRPRCSSAEVSLLPGSDLDLGWTGFQHDSDLLEGASVTLAAVRRCSNDDALCERDSDCDGGTCGLTCDCNGGDTECEITGPTGPKHCLYTLEPCETDSDCVNSLACVHTLGPPLPLSSAHNPICIVSVVDGSISGTVDLATGEAAASVPLRWQVTLGEAVDQPCPRCGRLDQNPQIGDEFTCEDGQFPNVPCTVEGVSPDFGGTSRDCPPTPNFSLGGPALSIRLRELTTGTVSKTAQLPCTGFQVLSHPSRGNGKCLDSESACTSNADCMRCTDDPATACDGNADCAGKGTCAEAPDQPITCGFWCHCGFCTTGGVQDPNLPCFDAADCPAGHTCDVGNASTATAPNNPQKQPNECYGDGFLCGMAETERCADTISGTCSEQDFRKCLPDSDTCQNNDAGQCVTDAQPCFESRITRTGEPSPLGRYCRHNPVACSTNADCGSDAPCVEDSAVPTAVALFCAPKHTSGVLTVTLGITGPGAVTFKTFVKVCRCGDGKIECDEECDDGNILADDGCDTGCRQE